MKELIYSEKYLKFIYQIFDGQIEAGKMIPAWVFKSDKKSCPVGRFEKLENEIRQTLLLTTNAKSYYSELASLKTLIEKVDLKAKEINVLHSEGKTDISKYLNYSYSNENFSLVYTMEGVKFKHETRHDYFGIIQYFRRVYQILEPLQQPPATIAGFKTTIHHDKLNPLFTRLIEKGYIAPGTDFNNFAACFNGLPLPDTFARVQWIKRQKRGKNSLAKKALTDLLFLMGTPQEQTRDKTKLETCFCDPTGNPLKFTQSNFYNSKDSKDNSEYFPELQNIINSL